MRVRAGDAFLLCLGTAFVLVVATFSHTGADAFLRFEPVAVSSVDVLLLGGQPSGTPASHAQIGDKSSKKNLEPAAPNRLLELRSDRVAFGLSRFSLLQEDPEYERYSIPGPIDFIDIDLSSVLPFPSDYIVQCMTEVPVKERVGLLDPTIENFLVQDDIDRLIPNCDYESGGANENFQIDSFRPGGRVAQRFTFSGVPGENRIGFLDSGTFSSSMQFNPSETALPIVRDNWKLGRKVRDGITLAFREVSGISAVRVEHSVLSWPVGETASSPNDGFTEVGNEYILSSWSRNCPAVNNRTVSQPQEGLFDGVISSITLNKVERSDAS